MPWTPGVWYTTVIRRWYTGDNQTHIGFFMYDYGTGKWTHYVTVVTPENNAYFEGTEISGFLEKFGGNPVERCGYWRNFWKLNEDGTWNKSTQIEASAGTGAWKAEQTSESEVKLYSCGAYTAPQSSYQFTLAIPEAKPTVVTTAAISSLTATFDNEQLTVNWQLDDTKSPQLSYEISVFNTSSLSDTPVAQLSGIHPEKRADTVSLRNLPGGTYYLSMQVKDIFEQGSAALTTSFMVDCTVKCVPMVVKRL